MNKYKNLEIWKRSVALATEVYNVTKSIPSEKNMESPLKLEDVLFQFHRILLKELVGEVKKNLNDF